MARDLPRIQAFLNKAEELAAGQCEPCARAALAKAKAYGATDAELSRSALLRGLLAGAGALALGSLLPELAQAQSPTLTRLTPGPLSAQAGTDADVARLSQLLLRHGYTRDAAADVAFQDGDTTYLYQIYARPGRPHDYGFVLYAHSRSLGVTVWAQTAQATRTPLPQETAASVGTAFSYTGYQVRAGGIVPLNGGIPGYNCCLIENTLACCGPAAVGCVFSGPAILECLLLTCSACFATWIAYCSSKCLFGNSCPC